MLPVLWVSVACSGTGSGSGGSAGTGAVGGAHAGDSAAGTGGSAGSSAGGAGGTSASGGTGGSGISLDGAPTGTPVRELENLTSMTFYERTGGTEPTSYEFAVAGSELTTRLADPLTDASHDIPGASGEFYDVYYSDEDGSFDLDGFYLTISGVFSQALPAGGGLNLAEISLNFTGQPPEFGNYLASYVALGDNRDETSVGNCIDGNLQTHTTMGNTLGQAERLRLTLGFESTSGPPK